jgi:hypothetical protein
VFHQRTGPKPRHKIVPPRASAIPPTTASASETRVSLRRLCSARGLSSQACATGKRASPGTVAARLIDFHFGSKPGACSLSIRENRCSTNRATR